MPCPSRRILDVGCGDGELAFYLESLGYDVVAIDHPTHNHNGMQGVRALRSALGSSIELHEVDLDRQFRLPHDSYDAVLFLGVLYHLRNPFYVLEELAKHAECCLLEHPRRRSGFRTAARCRKTSLLAYLLEERELNDDDSNYFIFSEPCLRVMLNRTFWKIRKSVQAGNTPGSDPIRRDGRVFCLLESEYGRLSNIELHEGWHDAEGSGWRWTRQRFSLSTRWDGSGTRHSLAMQLFVPPDHLARFGRLTLSILANGAPLAPAVFEKSGEQTLTRSFDSAETRFEFHLSGAAAGDDADPRERGIIVVGVSVQ